MANKSILSVSQINEYIKDRMDRDELLSFVCVSGEISNYKLYPSGHHYFSLKDPGGSLRCVMFKGNAARLRFRPENGMKVLAYGRISVFPRDGAYQLYCEQITPEGTGDLHVAFEQLKVKLQQEGLFDSQHKKKLPLYPRKIAIITSSAGAAIHDMLRILSKRYPLSQVLLLPVRVQGIEAPPEIIEAIDFVNQHRLADVIITGRGGGSTEDLWAFNDEGVARAIYRSEIPVISAVGHEPDVTISDYVADLRAATPSNAAELVVPDQVELREKLLSVQSRIQQAAVQMIKNGRQRINNIESARGLKNPTAYLDEHRMNLEHSQKMLVMQMQQKISMYKQQFGAKSAALDAMSPLKVLARGYSLTKIGGKILTDSADAKNGDTITVLLKHGEIVAEVTDVCGGEYEERT